MKQKLIYFALASFLFAGCSQNEVTDIVPTPKNSDMIGFSASTGKLTRANNNALTQLQTGFYVYALRKDGYTPIFSKPNPDNGNTISNKYVYDTDHWKWDKESDDKKWSANSADYPFIFVAAYDDEILVDKNFASGKNPWEGGSTPTTLEYSYSVGNTLANNKDVLAAYAEVTSKPANGIQELKFKHIMSNIKFQLITPKDYKIRLQSVKICNVANEGRSYDFYKPFETALSVQAGTSTSTYTHKSEAGETQAYTEYTGKENSAAHDIESDETDATWKLMPQDKTTVWDKDAFAAGYASWNSNNESKTWPEYITSNTLLAGAYIEVVYAMQDDKGKTVIGHFFGDDNGQGGTYDANLFVRVAYPLNLDSDNGGKAWEPNKQYTYQIKLGTPDATNGTVVDENFTDKDGNGSDTDIDNPAVKPGEDVSKQGYIGFDVIVDDWTVESNVEIK